MDKTYDPKAIEQRWYQHWENNGHLAPSGQGEPYCIMIPPPNVTGTLHMGHAFQQTVIDALIRFHRMAGHNTLWQSGTDHAGIATQMVVSRQLEAEGLTRHDLGREKFIERVWAWKEESGGTIQRQLRRLGASCDWSRERFTMDEGMSAAVQEVFVRLHEDGLIYRGKRLVNWDPVLHTAVSDIEVLSEETQGKLWHFRYPLTDGSGALTVATTRPETMLGDTAVAVHPDDQRFKSLVGKTITLPLVGRKIPIVADDYVDPEFGSGCVKITPGHDFNDYALGQRHDLPIVNVFTADAALNDEVPDAYRGLDRFVARDKLLADLDAGGFLVKTEDHVLKVPRGERSNSVIEPWLTDQWFVDLTRDVQPDGRPGGHTAITQPSIEAVSSGRVKFTPDNWANTYQQWLANIQDWCISRQLWWGHRIPAWYDETGNIYVGRSEAEVRDKHALDSSMALRQDDDVLDTWFSSALWPFSTLGWPDNTDALKTFYPGSVLVTGFDIIFFWVARMIMFGTRFMDGQVPFHDVYMHGLVRDATGAKMSKSKGNVLDPLDIIDGIELEALVAKRTSNMMQPHLAAAIEKQTRAEFPEGIAAYGTDALRFTFASLASNGRDIRFDLKRVEGNRNFCNKLFNATRFVLMNTESLAGAAPAGSTDVDAAPANRLATEPATADRMPSDAERNAIDRWIISELQQVEAEVARQIGLYRFDLAASALYEFIWNQYCDWYLELAKPLLNGENEAAAHATRLTLVGVLEATLRLAHPFMPFITEELWQQLAPRAGKQGDTISTQPQPVSQPDRIDAPAVADIDWVKRVVMGVRKIRSEMDINPGKKLAVLVDNASARDQRRLADYGYLLKSLARLESIDTIAPDAKRPESAVALVDEMKLLIPLAGLIDKHAELARLTRETNKLEKLVTSLDGKLGNPGFTAKAPAAVVEAERQKLADAQAALATLGEQQTKIAAL